MNHDIEKFKTKHADLIAKAEARGIDWKALWEKFGPLVAMILKLLVK